MRSIKFPNMFNSNNTRVWKSSEHHQATKQNTKILLNCERGELFGDPYWGLKFKHMLFDQNNYVLREQLIDMIYTQLALFMPQLTFERKKISVWQNREKGKLYCEFEAQNKVDYTFNTYQLLLFNDTEY